MKKPYSYLFALSLFGSMFISNKVFAEDSHFSESSKTTESSTESNLMNQLKSTSNEVIDSWMPDKSLQNAVAELLGKSVETISQADMLNLPTDLILRDSNLTSIKGLEYATNLQRLTLTKNSITDLTPIRNLNKLTFLDVGENQIVDINPIQNLTNLTVLFLNSNPDITDYSPVKNLTNIYYFGARYNQIADISFLSSLPKLKLLYLWGNQITDISPLKGLTELTNLELSHNQISDISELANLQNLTYLNLLVNNISDISYLKNLTQLTSLNFSNNQVEDISELKSLMNLNYLTFNNNSVRDISVIHSLRSLTEVSAAAQMIDLDTINIESDEYSQFSIIKYDGSSFLDLVGDDTSDGFGTFSNSTLQWSYLKPSGVLISRWNKVAVSPKFTFSGTITLPYQKIVKQTIVIKYLDESGNKVATTDTMTGNVGDTYSTTPKNIDSYTVKEVPTNSHGIFTNQPQEIIYVYEKTVGQPVIVSYQDEQGHEVAKTDTLTGNIGEAYTTKAKNVTGYTMKTAPENSHGMFTSQEQKVTFTYEKSDVSTNIKNDLVQWPLVLDTFSEGINKPYPIIADMLESPLSKFQIDADNNSVINDEEMINDGTVLVEYVDEDGNQIAPSEILHGDMGEDYQVDRKEIVDQILGYK